MRLWEIETLDRRTGASPTAPYRRYKRTDDEAFQDGYNRGLEWPARWDHIPGGPHVHQLSDRERETAHPDWVEHVDTLKRHNKLWLDGWHKGFRKQAETNPEIRALQQKLRLN